MPWRDLPILLLAALLWLPACPRRTPLPAPGPEATGPERGWRDIQAEEGFSFAMPGAPEVQRQNLDTAAGPLPLVMYLLESPHAAFNVTAATYPAGFMEGREPEAVLAGARDGAASNISGEILEQREIQVFSPAGGVALGLEVVMRTPERLLFRGRFFVVGSRLVQLSYVTQEDGGSEEEYRHFVESFILTAD
jgi:hypothetical protein